MTKPLHQKLGLKPEHTLSLVNFPEEIKQKLQLQTDPSSHQLQPDSDYIHLFTKDLKELEEYFPAIKKSLKQNGMVWISWPKKDSTVSTDLDGNKVRGLGLRHGLVDTKVAAIDDTWSGLKFVYRLKDRKSKQS